MDSNYSYLSTKIKGVIPMNPSKRKLPILKQISNLIPGNLVLKLARKLIQSQLSGRIADRNRICLDRQVHQFYFSCSLIYTGICNG